MAEQKKSILVIVVLTLAIITIHISGYIPYEIFVAKQLEGPEPLPDSAPVEARGNLEKIKYGFIQPIVIDGYTDEPISDAQVVIPELNLHLLTGRDGMTAPIKIPVYFDCNFEKINAKTWGEVTLIVYKENYIEYVLLYTQVHENEIRKGPHILLFPKILGGKNQPFAIIESPQDEWVTELVEKYRRDE